MQSSTMAKESIRIDVLDQMRGMALLAIFLCNLVSLSGTFFEENTIGSWLYSAVHIIFGDSSRTLFSFMFGISMLLIYDGAVRRGKRPYIILLRRMLTLLLIGGIHVFAVWSGDILFMYAMDGLMLLAFLWMKPIGLLSSGILLWILTSPWLDTIVTNQGWPIVNPAFLLSSYLIKIMDWLFPTVSIFEYPQAFVTIMEWQLAIQHLPYFLFGMYAYRKGIFQYVRQFPKRFAGLGIALLVTGLTVKAAFSLNFAMSWIPRLDSIYPIAYLAVTIGAVFCILVVGNAASWMSQIIVHFSAIGKMAFTCYLLQSLCFVTVFNTTGEGIFSSLGWLGAVHYSYIFTVAIIFFALQMIFCTYWLRYFQYGPFEWVWRMGTHLQIPPLRRASAS